MNIFALGFCFNYIKYAAGGNLGHIFQYLYGYLPIVLSNHTFCYGALDKISCSVTDNCSKVNKKHIFFLFQIVFKFVFSQFNVKRKLANFKMI